MISKIRNHKIVQNLLKDLLLKLLEEERFFDFFFVFLGPKEIISVYQVNFSIIIIYLLSSLSKTSDNREEVRFPVFSEQSTDEERP